MPQFLSAVYIHLVFSTKERRPLLRDQSICNSLHAYVGAVSKQLDCPTILVGGVEDHVHLLARFGRTIKQPEWVKELKRVSSIWLKEQNPHYQDFNWQGGYADFSVSQSNLDQVAQYISGRKSIIVKSDSRTNCGHCCANMKWNGMNDMSGIDGHHEHQPQPRWGCQFLSYFSRGRSFVATLGWRTESLWDSCIQSARLSAL